jgi:asparagine synthase (glutamine-hydrolysing)
MSHALEPESRFQRAAHHEQGFGFGRVGLGWLGSRGDVAWNAERSVGLVMEGELYDTAALEPWLDQGERRPAGQAELLLRLYERHGTAFLDRLNGAFLVAIWDRRDRTLIVCNDRLGLFPLYYASAGGLLFGSGVRAILADPAVDRSVDPIAINEFLLYDHALGDRTLVEAVRLLPQASILTFRDGDLAIRPYWTLRYPQTYEPQPEAAYVEGLLERLRTSTARQRPGGQRAAMLLSGGLDSRLLLGLLDELGEKVEGLTFGIPGCDDAKVAAEVARAVRAPSHFFELRPDWLLHQAHEAVRLTDGLGNIVNLHALATLEAEAARAEILYKGFMGDAILGFALKRQMWADYAPEQGVEVHRGVHNEQGVLNYAPHDEGLLLSDGFKAAVGDAAYQEYRDGMARAGVSQLANQRLYFDMTQRVPRMTLNGVEVVRSRATVRLPFCDNDLLDFALTVPPGFMFERYLPRTVLTRHFTKLAQIPIAGTGRPLAFCARDLAVQARELTAWHLGRVGLGRLAARPRRPYKDYNGWFRGVLRPWLEDLLLDRRTAARGYFNPGYVGQLVAEHMAGANHAVRLGALATIELWHRQFVD